MIGQNNVQALQRAIMEIAQQEVQTILSEAKATVAGIEKRAQERVQVESAHILEEAQQNAKTLVAQAAAKAQLEAQMLKLRRREHLLEHTFDVVRQRLRTIPQRPDYADIVKHLIREAVTYLDEQTFTLEADAVTRALLSEAFLKDLAEELGVSLELAPLEESPSIREPFEGTGVALTTDDGHRRYDNTLEARLTRMQDDLRTAVYHILVEEAS
jgi:vacuolar-type H+-ATPase subunit E/Vma4